MKTKRNKTDNPEHQEYGFKYVEKIIEQTNDLILESKGDYPRICFGLAYVAAMIALDQNRHNPLMGTMNVMAGFSHAMDNCIREGHDQELSIKFPKDYH